MNNNYQIQLLNQINDNNYFMVFIIKEQKYAISIDNILEVINLPVIEIPEKTPKGIMGMFKYNETILNVVDLCPFLGFDTPCLSVNNQLIIVKSDESVFAIHTENIEHVINLENQNIQDLPYQNTNSILSKIYKNQNSTVNIIDISRLSTLLQKNTNEITGLNYKNLFPNDEKSKETLLMRTKLKQNSPESYLFNLNLSEINQYILFNLDENNYYINLKYVKEIVSVKRLNIVKLPYTKDFINGLINVKGEFLVVIDLKCFLHNENKSDGESGKLIIVEGKNFNIAFLVDDVKYIKILKDIRQSRINDGASNYIYSEFMENDTLYSVLNIEKIINDERLYINIV